MSDSIGSILGPLISLTMLENMSMKRSSIFASDRQLGELLPFAVYTFLCPLVQYFPKIDIPDGGSSRANRTPFEVIVCLEFNCHSRGDMGVIKKCFISKAIDNE